MIYHIMADMFNIALSQIPVVNTLAQPIYYGLLYWKRMSEFTSDRAGLLACQDIDAAVSAIIKMSGLPMKYYDSMDRDAFIKQAIEFKKSFSGFTDDIIKLVSIMDETHPWTVLRAAELITWYESGEYQAILDGASNRICPVCHQQYPASLGKCPYCGYEG